MQLKDHREQNKITFFADVTATLFYGQDRHGLSREIIERSFEIGLKTRLATGLT